MSCIAPLVFIHWFGERNIFFSPVRDLVLDFFCGYTCCTLLSPSCGRILKLVYFLWIRHHTRPSADILPFVFSEVAPQLKVWFFSGPQNLACFLQVLTRCPPKLAVTSTLRSMHMELAAELGKVWVRSACCWGCQLLDSTCEAFPAAHG